MTLESISILLVALSLIAQLLVRIWGKPKSTGDLYETLKCLDANIQKLTNGLGIVVDAVEKVQARMTKQWERLDEHDDSLAKMDKAIGIIEAHCKWEHGKKIWSEEAKGDE